MNTNYNIAISVQSFSSLDENTKNATYQQANETHQVHVVRQLNQQGIKPQSPQAPSPSIASQYMDIATKYDKILGYLKELRQTHRLLTEQEFQPLSTRKWIHKNDINRMLGCDHIMRKIAENNLKYIKVPEKIAVIENTEYLNINGFVDTFSFYSIETDQIKVFAQEVKRVDRKLSRDEIDELITIVAAANFVDLWPANIFIAEDGVYFIDTEFKSFGGDIEWGKMGRFTSLVSEEDMGYFTELVNKKLAESRSVPQRKSLYQINDSYKTLSNRMDLIETIFSPEQKEPIKEQINELKQKLFHLELVGNKIAGYDYLNPNRFTLCTKDFMT